MNMGKAVVVSLCWIALALAFNAGIFVYYGPQKAFEFLAAYVIELSLSVDNIFVFLLIFSYFQVPKPMQTKILFWGVLGAQLMRGIFIFAGLALLNKFQWIMYVFGAFLVFTGAKLFMEKDKEMHPDRNPVLMVFKKIFPGISLFWIVLIIIETTDLIFAVDSIPAVLAISKDPLIVYSSNILAVLGLRAMYFVLAGSMAMFHYLHYALGAILVFVGFKMLAEHYINIPITAALGFIAFALTIAIAASLLGPKPKKSS